VGGRRSRCAAQARRRRPGSAVAAAPLSVRASRRDPGASRTVRTSRGARAAGRRAGRVHPVGRAPTGAGRPAARGDEALVTAVGA
jgi:hypothetical protein